MTRSKDEIERLEAAGASEDQIDTQKDMCELMEQDLQELGVVEVDPEAYKSSYEKLVAQKEQLVTIEQAL